jgi:hypothetical protein
MSYTSGSRAEKLQSLVAYPQGLLPLLHLPCELITAAARGGDVRRRSALQAQTATAIEMLIMVPMHISNLTKLDVERNLVWPGPVGTMHIVIAAEDTKNRQRLDRALPEKSAALIEHYLQKFRPCLASSLSTALFPGRHGLPKRSDNLGRQISRTIHSHTGMRIPTHLLRYVPVVLFISAMRSS